MFRQISNLPEQSLERLFEAARNAAYTREERNRYESDMMNENGLLLCERATKNLCAVFLGKSLDDNYLHIAIAHK